jgi:hypothetical protein
VIWSLDLDELPASPLENFDLVAVQRKLMGFSLKTRLAGRLAPYRFHFRTDC